MIPKSILSFFLILGSIGIIESAANMEKSVNLTTIRWAHAVNSQALLKEALNDDIDMIEGDIILGYLIGNEVNQQSIMGHPPDNKSDTTLEIFLQNITDYNNKKPKVLKGVKLDFKDINGFQNGIPIVKNFGKNLEPIWLNADILKGPGNASEPVNAEKFLTGAKEIGTNNTLSIGWTTVWNNTLPNAKYEQNHIDEMIKTIKDNNVANRNITFPVRAAFVANSQKELENLLTKTKETKNNATLTIWSGQGDKVDDKKLRDVILKIGVDRIYLDVPKELEQKLHLHSSQGSLRASLLHFSFVSLFMILISEYLKK